jgi:hypothetical protein
MEGLSGGLRRVQMCRCAPEVKLFGDGKEMA